MSDIIGYILIALLLASIFQLGINMFNRNKNINNTNNIQNNKSNLNEKNDNKGYVTKIAQMTNKEITDSSNKDAAGQVVEHMTGHLTKEQQDYVKRFERDKQKRIERNIAYSIMDDEYGQVQSNGKGCTVCSTDALVDDYIRRYLLTNANVCKKPRKFTCDELKRYRNDYCSFRNYTNQNSTCMGGDAVDKINDLYLSANYDIAGDHKGTLVKDLFDSITKYSGTVLSQGQCERIPSKNGVIKNAQYKAPANNGEYYINDDWTYGKENVENGGKFYKDIYANEDHPDLHKAYAST